MIRQPLLVVSLALLASACGTESTGVPAEPAGVWQTVGALPVTSSNRIDLQHGQIAGQVAFLEDSFRVLRILDATTGRERWRASFQDRIIAVDTIGGLYSVVTLSQPRKQTLLDPVAGRILSTREQTWPSPLSIGTTRIGTTLVELYGDETYVGRSVETGGVLWARGTARVVCVRGFVFCRSTTHLGVGGSTAYMTQTTDGAPDQVLVRVTGTGEVTSTPLSPSIATVIARERARGVAGRAGIGYVIDRSVVVAIDLVTGTERWRADLAGLGGVGADTFLYDAYTMAGAAGDEIVLLLGAARDIAAVRLNPGDGTRIGRVVVPLDSSRAPVYAGRCTDATFGFVYDDGTVLLRDLDGTRSISGAIAGLGAVLAGVVPAAFSRQSVRTGQGTILIYDTSTRRSVGTRCHVS